MQHFEGYVSHQLLVDADVPSHLLVTSQWQTREAADRIRDAYADAETVRRIRPLLSRKRGRWVFSEDCPPE
jgi:heme-degrading monooxygenase HmoA